MSINFETNKYWLVVLTILKTISQLGRIIPYIMENKKCSKPPTSYDSMFMFLNYFINYYVQKYRELKWLK